MSKGNNLFSIATRLFKRFVVFAFLLALLTVQSIQAREQVIALAHFDSATSVFGTIELENKLLDRLSGVRGLRVVIVPDSQWISQVNSTKFFDIDSVVSFGSMRGARFVINISEIESGIEVKKGLSIPLLFSRYSAVGTICGSIRIVDVKKRRLVTNEDFCIEKRGKSSWQPLEDNPYTSDLHIPATEKPRLYEDLEWKAADWLAKTFLKRTSLR